MVGRLLAVIDWFLPPDLQQIPDGRIPDKGRALVATLLLALLHTMVLMPSLAWQARQHVIFADAALATIILSALAIAVCLWLTRRWAVISLAAYTFAGFTSMTLTVLIALTGGFDDSPLVVHLLLQPALLFLIVGRRAALAWTLLVVLLGALTDVVEPPAAMEMSAGLDALLRLSSWAVVAFALFGCFWYFDFINRKLTKRVTQERDLAQFAAGHDPLTALLNRAAFARRLEAATQRAQLAGSSAILLFIDLDGFKVINDNCGHQTGDRLLQTLADRMRHTVRAGDSVARLGGDEFAVLIEGMATHSAATRIAEQLLAVLAAPASCGGTVTQVSASIGVAFCPADAVDPETLVHCADSALYQAKALGKNTAVFFSELTR